MIHNPKFLIKFNDALKELEDDKCAISTFSVAVMDVFAQFAKQNNISTRKLLETLADIHEKNGGK